MARRSYRITTAVFVTGALLFCSGPALAEEERVFQLDQITVTADRLNSTVAETPNSVTVISGEELQKKGARTLADALTGVSGVIVTRYGSEGQIAIPNILGTDRVVVLIDGKRLNLPQGVAHGHGGVDLSTIMLGANVDRIEVVRGGASVLYGADAVGGVINVITKKGNAATANLASIASGNYGSRDFGLSLNGGQNKASWSVSGLQNQTDGQRANSKYKGRNLSSRLDYELDKATDLVFTYDYFGSHSGMPGSASWTTPTAYGDTRKNNWSLAYDKKLADGNRLIRYYSNNQTYSGDDGSSGGFRHENTVQAFEYQDSARFDGNNLLTWGGEWRKDKVVSSGEGNPHSGITRALYLQNRYTFNALSSLCVGVRRDGNSIYGDHWLPQASYLYQANAEAGYFLNWRKVFKAPNFDELYYYSPPYMYGNSSLRPETGWTAEAGVKLRLGKASDATLSVFRRNLNDAIRWQQDDPSQPFTSPWRTQNIASYKARGVSLTVGGRLSPATMGDFGYTYLDSRDADHNPVGEPRHSFHLGFNIDQGKWRQNITAIYQDKSGTVAAGTQIAGNFVVNTNTDYCLDKKTTLFLKIQNLFNRKYQDVMYYPAAERTLLFGVRTEF